MPMVLKKQFCFVFIILYRFYVMPRQRWCVCVFLFITQNSYQIDTNFCGVVVAVVAVFLVHFFSRLPTSYKIKQEIRQAKCIQVNDYRKIYSKCTYTRTLHTRTHHTYTHTILSARCSWLQTSFLTHPLQTEHSENEKSLFLLMNWN